MPGMPIFQDSPGQLKSQIYVWNNVDEEIAPLEVDATGQLAVTGTVDVDTITTLGTITNDVKVVNGATDLDIGTVDTVTSVTTLGTITNDVGVVNGATDLDIGTVATVTSVTTLGTITNDVGIVNGTTAFAVGISAGTNVIGKVQSDLVFTDTDSFGGPTPLTSKTITALTPYNATSMDISTESSYGWFLKNTGVTPITQTVTIVVQISPDGTNWMNDTGTTITVSAGESTMINVTHFLHYARFVITGGTADTTVISCYQAQH